MEEELPYKEIKKIKCPELNVQLNKVPVTALIDTGSQINAVSTDWYHSNKKLLGNTPVLKVTNLIIKGAVGKKSNKITQQVMLELKIGEYVADAVFIIVPNLIRDCIIGINLLQEGRCIINLPNNKIIFKNSNDNGEDHVVAEIITIAFEEAEEEGINNTIQEKLAETSGIGSNTKEELKKILEANKQVFREIPGRINKYEHKLTITDTTPYCLKGWPVPLKYQNAVEEEIKKMEKCGVIELSLIHI